MAAKTPPLAAPGGAAHRQGGDPDRAPSQVSAPRRARRRPPRDPDRQRRPSRTGRGPPHRRARRGEAPQQDPSRQLPVGSTVTGEPAAAAAGRAPSESHASAPKTAAQRAAKPRKPLVASVRRRSMATVPKAPTARLARSVQLMKARFRAIWSAGIAPSVEAGPEVGARRTMGGGGAMRWDSMPRRRSPGMATPASRSGRPAEGDPHRPLVRQPQEPQASQRRARL